MDNNSLPRHAYTRFRTHPDKHCICVQLQTHQRYRAELEADFQQRLEENKAQRLQLESERDALNREYDEVQQQLEDDVDQEIEQLRRKYEEKLATAREATLKYKASRQSLGGV